MRGDWSENKDKPKMIYEDGLPVDQDAGKSHLERGLHLCRTLTTNSLNCTPFIHFYLHRGSDKIPKDGTPFGSRRGNWSALITISIM